MEANDSNKRKMGEFAETSSAKKPNPAFVTVKATVRGQHQEIQFESESLLLLLEHLVVSGKNRELDPMNQDQAIGGVHGLELKLCWDLAVYPHRV
jgi:hypothetical protein